MQLVMTTGDRSPSPNYLGQTLRSLEGVHSSDLHVFATNNELRWLSRELESYEFTLHVPNKGLTRNQNGVAALAYPSSCEWVLYLEDDLAFCKDFINRVNLWLERHATDKRSAYSFFNYNDVTVDTLTDAYEQATRPHLRSAQAVAFRPGAAREFAKWAERELPSWHCGRNGFDKLLGYWLWSRGEQTILTSFPSFVQHIGVYSLAHFPFKGNDKRVSRTFQSEWQYV